ncbi:MAG: WD40/YVTN/BNR-like repeat-containing protein, partial [Flavobacteriia bacterium]
MKKLKFIILISLIFSAKTFAQNLENVSSQETATWVQMMQDPTANFYDVQAAFYSYWDGRTIEKGKGYKAFKRWENYMAPRVYPTGNMTLPSQTYTNYKEWERDAIISTDKSVAGDWTFLGPVGKPVGGGAGRVNFVRFDPNDPNVIYVGTPDGGLWKTTNGGTSWTVLTEQLEAIGCSDIAIDPNNSQILYLGTGDSDGGDSYSIGLLKSTDGGLTWGATGLVHSVAQGRTISRVLIDPTNSNTILVAASNGIFRSVNAGANFTSVNTGSFKDLEFKPGDPSTVYAVGTSFRKSTNNGQNWTTISSGLTTTGVERISLAVTAANSSYVYLLYGSSSDQGLLGVYRSTDSGTTFTQRADGSPNYLGWSSNGSDAGGQAFYDLTIAASPTNAEQIMIGGINAWKSINGGTSWTLSSHWTGSGAPYVHADHHDIQFYNGTTIFDCNDGGIYKSTNGGTSWSDISSNLGIAQQYRIGLSTSNPSLIIAGHQDNGTNKLNGNTWTEVYGGDGMDCFIDRTNNNTIIGSYVYGEYYKSTNGGSNFSDITNGLPVGQGSADWLSVIHQDPVTANTYYAGGRSSIYKTTNGGSSWTSLGTPNGSNSIIEFAIAPSNNQIIYSVKQNSVSKSTNGGTTWAAITTGLPVTTLQPTNVAISNTDPNIVYVTFSGYNSSSKVFRSTNGGTSWTNISSGLPNVPCNTIVYHNSS